MPSAWLSTHLRAARPRALAALNRVFGDIDLAEDAFQEASLKALRSWSPDQLPADTVAWLIVAGRNAGIDTLRKRRRETLTAPEDLEPTFDGSHPEDGLSEDIDHAVYRDDILRLLFTCCHPVLRKDQQIALSLKVVAGLSVEEVARAFLVQPKTMEQRITRAKKKLQAARLDYEVPDATGRAQRLSAVANAIYLVFNEGYSASQGSELIRETLCEEAVRLARLLVRLFPEEPELRGLLALCLIQHSRRQARLDGDGQLVTLEHQDRTLWDRRLIAEGNILLQTALLRTRPGPLQIEAAIAATHTRAASYDDTDWAEIDRLYRALEHVRPSPVVALNRAVVQAKLEGPEAALMRLEPLAAPLERYPGYHTVRASFLAEIGRFEDAQDAYRLALALAGTEVERAYIRRKLAGAAPEPPPV
ncbi:RNA polymerase sigma factor [Roseibium sediminicola]|uniref:RNA polymerase sigma factor n=1 Tax=Roseibium sediminicola TaxID=2933272 RepID=A0ABT0GMC8_9HYPH|nr:RNA polymerase sigma factor [Roseibium sp. CAU 1639]MCK7610581.1 RNA polymerase sigma factor [Roseibium sp. CAU 1639]